MATVDELTPRERRVLEAVIQTFVQTAEPTGSRVLSRRFGLGVEDRYFGQSRAHVRQFTASDRRNVPIAGGFPRDWNPPLHDL